MSVEQTGLFSSPTEPRDIDRPSCTAFDQNMDADHRDAARIVELPWPRRHAREKSATARIEGGVLRQACVVF